MPKIVKVSGNTPSILKMFSSYNGYKTVWDSDKLKPDLIVFPGGADINPALYGESALDVTYYRNKDDQYDVDFYNKFKDVPKVGICRGAQFLNVMSGGALWQHVNNHTRPHLMHNVLNFSDKSWSKDTPIRVTSTHHQMMIPDNSGEVLAFAEEATRYLSANKDRSEPEFDTEVVWYEHTQSLCFQPHPEYALGDNSHTEYFFDLLDYFFK